MIHHELVAKAVHEDEQHLARPGLDPQRRRGLLAGPGQRRVDGGKGGGNDVRDARVARTRQVGALHVQC